LQALLPINKVTSPGAYLDRIHRYRRSTGFYLCHIDQQDRFQGDRSALGTVHG
jgi:hypothetical protein